MIETILQFYQERNVGDEILDLFSQAAHLFAEIDWPQIIKIALFVTLASLLTVMLLIVNDKVFEFFSSKRIRQHHLTIKNNGNVPSIFLFRTIDLPKQLAVRFRIAGTPMIWVSRAEPKNAQPAAETKPQEVQKPSAAAAKEPSLLPDLNDPFASISGTAEKTVDTARNTANAVGRKFGLFAGILGSISSLLPKQNKALMDAQKSLKDVQQATNTAVQNVNAKVGSVNTLKNQIGSLTPGSPVQGFTKSGISSVSSASGVINEKSMNVSQTSGYRDLVYDEDVWRMNIGKVDDQGGDLNYAQSKSLQPGEAMRVDVEIMNLSESTAPVSLLYKIEVVQIPLTNLPLAAPREYINGIVIFPKITLVSQVLPLLLIVGLIFFSIQILAAYSHLVF